MACGRRWGKTMSCANAVVANAWEDAGEYFWVAPTYKLTQVGWRMINKFEGAFDKFNISDMQAYMINGSRIDFISADRPQFAVGVGYKGGIIDEAALIKPLLWQESIRPSLTDYRGWVIMAGTPKGQGWFYQEWIKGNSAEYPQYKSFSFPTVSNPYIDPKEVAQAKSELPEDTFRQEYLAEFLEEAAGVFRHINQILTGGFEEPKPDHEYVIGWDIAKHADFSVMIVMDCQTRHTVHIWRERKVDYRVQLQHLGWLAKKYNNAQILLDSTGVGDPILEEAQALSVDVEGYKFTNESKTKLVQNLSVGIQNYELSIPENAIELINEMRLYQYEYSLGGRVKYSAPDGFHDDCVTAQALAYWKLTHQSKVEMIWV